MNTSNDDIRIRSLTATRFRGSPGTINVDFLSSNNLPVSALITGDNGVGKSTILDAIEFACQGRVGRISPVSSHLHPHVPSYVTNSPGCVAVELSNGESINRSIGVDADSRQQIHGDRIPGFFQVAPMCLKRADVLRLLDTHPAERARLFFDHFSLIGFASDVTPDARELALQNKRSGLKQRRQAVEAVLAELAGVARLPQGMQFDVFIRDRFYRGFSKRLLARKGVSIQVPAGLEDALREYRELTAEIAATKRAINALPNKKPSLAGKTIAKLRTTLGDVSSLLTHSMLELVRLPHVRALRVEFGNLSEASIEILVELSNGNVCAPRQIFSEGHQDLVAMLFFLATAQSSAAHGQARVLLLDDVVQSVDAPIRVALMDYVMRHFSEWQLIVTVHDRLWRSQLRELMQRHGHDFVERDIRGWTFDGGPKLSTPTRCPGDPLRGAVRTGEVSSICAEAGRLVEAISDRLSWTLPVSVQRKRDDRYTLGELWPAVRKGLKGTNVEETVAQIDQWLHLRNMFGAHYNEWAEGISLTEAEGFSAAALRLLSDLFCAKCNQWIERRAGGDWLCRCGQCKLARK